MNQLGEFIKGKRSELGLSLRDFGELCGISHTHVDSIEKGVDFRTGKPVRITNETLVKVAKALNVDPAFLFSLSINNQSTSTEKIKKTKELTDDEIINLAAHKVGHEGKLSDDELEKVKMAIQIALMKHKK